MIKDDSGVETSPITVAGTLILVSLVFFMAIGGLERAMQQVNITMMEMKVNKIAESCRSMLASPPGESKYSGARCSIIFEAPKNIDYISFGSDPDSNESHEGILYYSVSGNKRSLIVDESIIFRETMTIGNNILPSTKHLIITSPGKYEINFMLFYDKVTGKKYILSNIKDPALPIF